MPSEVKVGDIREYVKTVHEKDFAAFDGQLVHAVCSTFALAQAVEYASRLFALDIMEVDEEGIGTMLKIEHSHPAFLHETIVITATLEAINRNELICSFKAKVAERVVATGETGQKILKKEKLAKLLNTNRA